MSDTEWFKMKRKLKCGCEIDIEEIMMLPIMTCPNCGYEHRATPFCGYCGWKLDSMIDKG